MDVRAQSGHLDSKSTRSSSGRSVERAVVSVAVLEWAAVGQERQQVPECCNSDSFDIADKLELLPQPVAG